MKHLHAFGQLAFTAIATAALAACGGSDSPTPKAPAFKLEIVSTEAFPGTYGDVGEYETVKGTLSGEVDPAGQLRRQPGPPRSLVHAEPESGGVASHRCPAAARR